MSKVTCWHNCQWQFCSKAAKVGIPLKLIDAIFDVVNRKLGFNIPWTDFIGK